MRAGGLALASVLPVALLTNVMESSSRVGSAVGVNVDDKVKPGRTMGGSASATSGVYTYMRGEYELA